MASDQQPTERLQVTLALKTHAFLTLLAGKGMHGTSVTDVAKGLIEKGIRDARRDGHFTADEIDAIQGKK